MRLTAAVFRCSYNGARTMANIDAEKMRAYELQAGILAVLANPKRLMIMDLLGEGPQTVSEIAARLDMTLQNASQHLRLMKQQSIVRAQRDGQAVTYSLSTPVFKDACEMVRKTMIAEVRKRNEDLSRARI
jgi:DNA-binding transcriptional ArsR family regulator